MAEQATETADFDLVTGPRRSRAKRLLDMSMEETGSTPAELAQFMREERERWGKVIRASGAKAD